MIEKSLNQRDGLHVDRDRVRNTFAKYTAPYDITDEKIKLKVDHTYRVAELCEQIAVAQGLEHEEADLAWVIGMLHDIGRFEQLRLYGTFVDAVSIDHAQFGADILFREGHIRDYLPDELEDLVIETAIRNHSLYRIEEGLDERTKMYCQILRDADKIDILKVNVDVPLEEIYNTTTKELRTCQVSDAVMESFKEEHATLRSLKKTPVDYVVGHISLVFELVYPISRRLVVEQGYLDKLLSFESENSVTKEQFRVLQDRMRQYLDRKLS